MLPPAREMMSYLRILEKNLREVSQRRPLLGPSPCFKFKTLLRHYAKRALTPRSLNVKLAGARFYYLTNPPIPYDLCVADPISR